jgi:hypothetical protein
MAAIVFLLGHFRLLLFYVTPILKNEQFITQAISIDELEPISNY